MAPRNRLIAAGLLAGGMLFAQMAAAQTLTPVEQAMLASLGPELQAEIRDRMSRGNQKLDEVIDTILLNKISLIGATRRIVATDMLKGVVVTETSDGQIRALLFNVTTLELRPR